MSAQRPRGDSKASETDGAEESWGGNAALGSSKNLSHTWSKAKRNSISLVRTGGLISSSLGGSSSAMSVRAFAPRIVLEKLAQQKGPLHSPLEERLEGAVVFADTSGFTQLSQRLRAKYGSTSAERLSRAIEPFFEKLVRIISDHDGDVVKFAGDALLILWTKEQFGGDLGRCVRVATQAALTAAQALHGFDCREGTPLSLHCGVACGQLTAMWLGGMQGKWEFVLDGPSMMEIGACVDAAQRGEVCCTPAVWGLLESPSGQLKIPGAFLVEGHSPSREPIAKRKHVVLSPSALFAAETAYVPAVMLTAKDFTGGAQKRIAEMRHTSVLFIKLLGLQSGASLIQWHTALSVLQKIIFDHDGTLNKVLVDDKGVVAVAVFGLPPLSHMDDPQRACLAGLKITSALGKLPPLSCQIGISSSRNFCGMVGPVTRREYTVMGFNVNIAARLMAAARPRAVLVDESTYLECVSDIDFEQSADVSCRGVDAPVKAFRVLRVIAFHKVELPLVGRQAEVAKLKLELDRLTADELDAAAAARYRSAAAGSGPAPQGPGQHRVIILDGERGVGKSRVLAQIETIAEELAVPCLFAGDSGTLADRVHRPLVSDASRAPDPFGPPSHAPLLYGRIQNVIVELLGGSQADLAVQLESYLKPDEPDYTPLLRDGILGVQGQENSHTLAMRPGARARMLHELLVRVLASLRLPFVMAIDSAENLQSAEWDLITSAKNLGITVVLAMRPVMMMPVQLKELCDHPETVLIKVKPLSSENSARLTRMLLCPARRELPESAFPDVLVDTIMRWAEGNCYFLTAAVKTLMNRGLVVHNDDVMAKSQRRAVARRSSAVAVTPSSTSGNPTITSSASGSIGSPASATLPSSLPTLSQLQPQHHVVSLAGELDVEELPWAIESELIARVDRLPAKLRVILKIGAVLGASFPLSSLVRASSKAMSERHIEDNVAELVARDFLLHLGSDVSFCSESLRRVLLINMLASDKNSIVISQISSSQDLFDEFISEIAESEMSSGEGAKEDPDLGVLVSARATIAKLAARHHTDDDIEIEPVPD